MRYFYGLHPWKTDRQVTILAAVSHVSAVVLAVVVAVTIVVAVVVFAVHSFSLLFTQLTLSHQKLIELRQQQQELTYSQPTNRLVCS